MAKFEWSEIFTSIEGEAQYVGHATTYVRFVKCNFTCQGFNNPEMKEITNEVLGFNPADIKTLDKCPPIEIGCDSIYSWDDRFKHMWHKGDENELADAIMEKVPHNQWTNPISKQPTIFSITGGEPTLRAKFIPALLNTPQFADLRHLLIETNCSVPLKQSFIDELNTWLYSHPERKYRRITWSNSPKLAVSGEPWDKAIRPEVAMMQRGTDQRFSDQYFKFVCGADQRDFDEVKKAMAAYYEAGVPEFVEIYIMPVACTEEQQQEIAAQVADMCIDHGFIYCHRVHNSVYKNAIGK